MAFAAHYLERFTDCRVLIDTAPQGNLNMIITIPCYDEENTLLSLESLYHCCLPDQAVEVIILINYPENASQQVAQKHQDIYRTLTEWSASHSNAALQFFPILEALPIKHAGVGLARKTAMDEAVRRFDVIDNPHGIIAGFDADCICDSNYLQLIEHFFRDHKHIVGCSIYFEHALVGKEFPNEVYRSIILYELYLRYYVEGLRFAGYPNAFHTIGSSFAVKTNAYASVGGMNKRKAGEDFYFLQKLMNYGLFSELNTTCIHASPRPSQRVPFGTGAAITKMLAKEDTSYLTFEPKAFDDLKIFFQQVEKLFKCEPNDLKKIKNKLSHCLIQFEFMNDFDDAVTEMNGNCASVSAFRKRFYQWFDGLVCLQYLNFAHTTIYKKTDVVKAASLMALWRFGETISINPKELLLLYRAKQKGTKVEEKN